MEVQLFSCPMCREGFNLLDKIPRNLPMCGHLICSSCLNKILVDKIHNASCPLDFLDFPQELSLEMFPINTVVQKLLEDRQHNENCEDSNEIGKRSIFVNKMPKNMKKTCDLFDQNEDDLAYNFSLPNPFRSLTQNCTFNAHMDFELDGTSLSIRTSQTSNEIFVDLTKLAQAEMVTMHIDKELPKEELEFLKYIWKRIKNPLMLRLKLESGYTSDYLCKTFAKESLSCPMVLIDMENYNTIRYCGILVFIQKVLSQQESLEVLNIRAKNAKFLNKNLGKISYNSTQLKALYLDLSETNLKDNTIRLFFPPMPHLEQIKLLLPYTEITDVSLSLIARRILSGGSLDKIWINVDNNKITDIGMGHVIEKLTNVKQLFLSLNETKITDKTPQLLCEILSKQSYYLTNLVLHFVGTKLTDKGLIGIFREMPSLRQFGFVVGGPNITDKILQNFITGTLAGGTSLEELEIGVIGTKVTDWTILELSKRIQNLKHLSLILSSPDITEKSVKVLVEVILSKMKNLVSLGLVIDGATIEEELKTEINLLLDRTHNIIRMVNSM